ncbi:hypothetical protein [Rhizocola hellebori]|uniref:hypothetical protein n=1 Tax=Rhizocola hellebori TaxID=1392758 RepID=UPI0019459FC9|nr:hypothetical protein [Rhizocola hellebori]
MVSTLAAVFLAPAGAQAQGIISALSVSPSQVRDGASALGTVTLIPLDATPTTVLLFSSDPGVASVPPSVVAPAGQGTVTFTITTNAAAPPTIVQITAAIQNVPRQANLSVNAATPPGPSLSAVSVTPSTLTGGSAATGTVTFTGATNGAVVQLSSSNPALVGVPSETVVNGGASTGAFPVTTAAVAANTTVSITASWFAITRTTTITLTPGAPAPADRVAITKARWKRGLLTIEATSTNPNAILSVFTQSGGFMFTLTNNGGGRYSDQRGWVTNPQVITVRSNFGGSATATLTS